MKKLISMTDFVLEQNRQRNDLKLQLNKNIANEEDLKVVVNYANFLKQPLELWMFVPCDEDGNVLEEPKIDNYYYNSVCSQIYCDDKKKYKQAKERCLFKGFKIVIKDYDKKPYKFIQGKYTYVAFLAPLSNEWKKVNDYKCLEHLVLYQLQLTKTALKQIQL